MGVRTAEFAVSAAWLDYDRDGGGRFEDVTARAGLDDPTDKAMGIAVLDYNTDGWPDIFIGSDRVQAKLYRNDGHRRSPTLR